MPHQGWVSEDLCAEPVLASVPSPPTPGAVAYWQKGSFCLRPTACPLHMEVGLSRGLGLTWAPYTARPPGPRDLTSDVLGGVWEPWAGQGPGRWAGWGLGRWAGSHAHPIWPVF